jgi:predicted transcriptional regulator
MPQTLVEIAKDLTMALIETGNVPPADMQETLQKTHATLSALKAQEEGGPTTTVPTTEPLSVDWRKSITRHAVTCLECGATLKQLTRRHLRLHGLDSRSYRLKYGVPRSQPLAARQTTTRRRQIVRQTRPWEKAAQRRKGQEQQETKASRAQTPAQPQRQRTTTPKKQAARKTRANA